MNEQELRKMLRKEIKSIIQEGPTDVSFLDKVGGAIRSKLGANKQVLNRVLGGLNTDRLNALTPSQKVDLLVALVDQFGLTSKDFNQVKTRVSQKLTQQANIQQQQTKTMEPDMTNEDMDAGLQAKSLKATQTNAFKIVVKTLEVKNADQQAEFLIDMLKGLPLKPNALMKLKRRFNELKESSINEIDISPDNYVSIPEAIGAVLAVLTGAGLLMRHELKKAQKEIEDQMDVKVSNNDIKAGAGQVGESKRNPSVGFKQLKEASIPADMYASIPEAIGAVLAVLTGAGLLMRHEMKKAQKEIEDQMDVKVSDKEIKAGASQVGESKRPGTNRRK
jgi:hypothetical protein